MAGLGGLAGPGTSFTVRREPNLGMEVWLISIIDVRDESFISPV